MSPSIGGYHADSLAPMILQLYAEGFRGGDIAAHLGCSHANVSQTLTRYGQANQRAPRQHTDRRALALPPAARLAYANDPSPDRLTALLNASKGLPAMPPATPGSLTAVLPFPLPGPICGSCARKNGFRLKAVTTPGYGTCRACGMTTATFPPDAWADLTVPPTEPTPAPASGPAPLDGIEEEIAPDP